MLLRDSIYKTGQLDQGSTEYQKLLKKLDFIQIYRVHQMLTKFSINILVQVDERT